jgi:hypothetical protein
MQRPRDEALLFSIQAGDLGPRDRRVAVSARQRAFDAVAAADAFDIPFVRRSLCNFLHPPRQAA